MKITLKAEAEDVKSKNGTIKNAKPEAKGLYGWYGGGKTKRTRAEQKGIKFE